MRYLKGFLITFLLFFFVANTTISQSISDNLKNELKNKLEEFVGAYQNYNGKKATDLVSQNSINYYYKYKSYALYVDYEKLVQMDVFDIMMTLAIRASFSKDEIINLGKKEFFLSQYNKKKKIGRNERPSNNILFKNFKRIDSNSISVMTTELASGKSKPAFYVKENGEWKIDLAREYEFLREYYKKHLPRGMSKKEFIYNIINQFAESNNNLLEPLINQ